MSSRLAYWTASSSFPHGWMSHTHLRLNVTQTDPNSLPLPSRSLPASGQPTHWIFFFSLKNFSSYYLNLLFIYLFKLRWVLVAARGIFVAACGIFSCGMRTFSCGMRTLSCSMQVGSSSPTRDRTWAPCIGSAESYPLDHQQSPSYWIFCSLLLKPKPGSHPWFLAFSHLSVTSSLSTSLLHHSHPPSQRNHPFSTGLVQRPSNWSIWFHLASS